MNDNINMDNTKAVSMYSYFKISKILMSNYLLWCIHWFLYFRQLIYKSLDLMYVYWKEDMWLEELQLQKKLFQVCMELLLMLQSNLAGLFEL